MMTTKARQRTREARPLDLDASQGTILVTRSAYGTTQESGETVSVPIFHTSPARVRVVGSVTRNLGDYNSARVEVMIEVPCYPEESEITRAYDYASSLVDRFIPQELDKAMGTETENAR